MVVFDDNSYVKLFRKLEKWEWYLDIYTTKLFIHCLIKANWEDKKWKGILIKRGSFVTSLSNLARESGLSVRNVRTSLKRLESTQEVTRLSTAKYTIITVLNYDRYQSTDKVSDKQVTNKRQTSDKQVTTTKEYKEYKEYKEDEEYIESIGDKKADAKKSTRFIKPTLEEIHSHILNKNYSVNAETFYNYYEANGWKVGKNNMKSWTATLAMWNSRNQKNNSKSNNKNLNIGYSIQLPDYYTNEITHNESLDIIDEVEIEKLKERLKNVRTK